MSMFGAFKKSDTDELVSINSTIGGVVVVEENFKRISLTIQNHGTVPVLLRFDGTPSITAYNIILNASSGARNGTGGSFTTTTFKGSIKAITEAGTTTLSILEEVER